MIFILILVFALIIFLVIRSNKKMKAKINAVGAKDAVQALHIEGLGLGNNAFCTIYHLSDSLLIEQGQAKFEIKLQNLRAISVKNEREIIEANKSVVGRALIGTLIMPGLGTIVGGMSGIGTKKKKGKTNFFLILNYMDQNNQLQGITFVNNVNPIKLTKFSNAIQQSLPNTITQL